MNAYIHNVITKITIHNLTNAAQVSAVMYGYVCMHTLLRPCKCTHACLSIHPPDACLFACMEHACVLMPVCRCDYVCKLLFVWPCMYAYACIFLSMYVWHVCNVMYLVMYVRKPMYVCMQGYVCMYGYVCTAVQVNVVMSVSQNAIWLSLTQSQNASRSPD